MSITIDGISKRFGSFAALERIQLEVAGGSLVALLGPSGSGKTTLLRILGGLETADEGRVLFSGEDMTSASARSRHAGFVFQHYALFRHMSVFENIAFGMRIRRRSELDIRRRVGELLDLVGLQGLGVRYPSQLSGGQRQRVALARALAIEPKILLLDEPFGALDAKVRAELRRWLRRLHDELHITGILVTHDQEEAFEVADRVVLMNRGRIEQQGTPAEIFDRPANPFVMDFLGHVNVFHGRLEGGRAQFGDFAVEVADAGGPDGSAVRGYVRPHEIELSRTGNGHAALPGKVRSITPTGSIARLEVIAESLAEPLRIELDSDRLKRLGLAAGDAVFVSPRQVRVFPDDADYSI
jgi:sulfate transport system ATP-binding protein